MRNKFYYKPGCPHCLAARAFLVASGADFVEFDITRNRSALQAMLTMTGRSQVPSIIAGYDAVVGFDELMWSEFLVRSEHTQRADPMLLDASLGRDPYADVD